MKSLAQEDASTPTFITAVFLAEICDHAVHECMDRENEYIYTTEYCSATGKMKSCHLQAHGWKWESLCYAK